MKKIVALVCILMGFVGFGFSQNYASGCVDGKVDPGQHDCKFCNGILFNTGNTIGTIQFYKDCCPKLGSLYDNNKKCCNGIPYDNNKKCCDGLLYDNVKQCCEKGKTILNDGSKESCISCDVIAKEDAEKLDDNKKNNCLLSSCDDSKKYQLENGLTVCCPGMVVTGNKAQDKLVCIVNTEGNLGINMNSECLVNGQCSYNIYKTLGIRKSDQNPKVSTFIQDIVLGVTMFLGTVIAILLIVSGILYIIASIQGSSSKADMAKKGIINSLLGLVLVTGSYAIVRLIQFVATAGGG